MHPGVFFNELVMRLPRIEERIEVSGTVFYSDGRPVGNQSVSLEYKPAGNVEKGAVRATAENGNFRLDVLKGLAGTLTATVMAYSGAFQNCPEVERLIQETGKQFVVLRTNELRLMERQDRFDIQLSFPFRYCEKAEQPK